jgi:hypothetical protein
MLDMMAPSKAADAMLRAARLCMNDRRAHYDAILEHLASKADRSTAFAALEVALPAGREGRLDDKTERAAIQARAEAVMQATVGRSAISLQ